MSSSYLGPLDSSSSSKYPIIELCDECGKKHFRNKYCPMKHEICIQCRKEHSPYITCPNIPCEICYKEDHYLLYCPFLDNYPRGEDFDRTEYEIVCLCGSPFDTDKWLCTLCPYSPFPKLQLRDCELDAPLNFKLDAIHSTRKFIPYRGKSAVAASSGDR